MQTYGKAVQRCARNLPSSPLKRKAVICGLAKRVGIRQQLSMKWEITPHKLQRDEVVSCLKEFYFPPDIVYTMLGMKGTWCKN